MKLLPKPSDCYACPLFDSDAGLGFSLPEGTCASGLMAVGEASGDAERDEGLPFRPQAQAGGVLHRALTSLGVDRTELGITNVIRCHPPNNYLDHAPYEYAAIAHCQTHMDAVVAQFRPRLFLALGGIPARTLTGWSGKKKSISSIRGYVIDGGRYPDIPVLSTYHPSYIARGKSNVDGVLRHDIKAALRLAREGWERPRLKTIWAPSREVREAFKQRLLDDPRLILYYDIETEESAAGVDEADLKAFPGGIVQVSTRPEEFADDSPESAVDEAAAEAEASKTRVEQKRTRITQIQFSVDDETGLVMPFEGEFVGYAMELMALRGPKCSFNGDYFDDPLLYDAGVRFGSRPFDLMKLFNHVQKDLPRGLQYVTSFWWPELGPWKHLSDADPQFYGCCDVVAPARVFPRVRKLAEEYGIWDGFLRNVHELHRLRLRCSARGMSVDTAEQARLDEEIRVQEEETFARLQTLYPEELKRVEPANGYVSEKVAEKWMLKPLADGERWEQRDFAVAWKEPAPLPKASKAPKGKGAKGSKGAKGKPRKKKGESDEQWQARVAEWEAVGVAGAGVAGAGDTDSGDPAPPEAPPGDGRTGDLLEVPAAGVAGEVPGDLFGVAAAPAGAVAVAPSPVPPTTVPVLRWCRVQPFLPNSPKQILSLLRYWSIPPPRSFKEDKETTAKDELKKLAKKFPVLQPIVSAVIDYREFKKIRSTYIEGWKAEMKDPRGFDRPLDLSPEESAEWERIGFVHPTFVPWPATGQTGARNPNSTNVPAPKGGSDDNKSRLAIAIRRTVRAKPRWRLVDLDWNSFHVLTLGFNAKDPHYMWLARRDPHSFIAGCLLKVPGHEKWMQMIADQNEELTDILKWWKKSDKLFDGKPFVWHRNKRAKPGILMIGFGGQANKLWQMNEESFSSRKDAQSVIDMVFWNFGKIKLFQNNIRQLAYDQKYLQSPHGYRRWFWDVYHMQKVAANYDPKPWERVVVGRNGAKYKQVWGEDSEAAIAFLPANNAFGHKHDVLWELEEDRRLDERGLLERYGWCNDEHDGLKFHCREELVEECVWEVAGKMQERSKVLVNEAAPEGLWCGVEASVGEMWAGMEEVKVHPPLLTSTSAVTVKESA